MPQLMPLNWVFSSLMMLLLLVSASVIYSKDNNSKGVKSLSTMMDKMKNMWFW